MNDRNQGHSAGIAVLDAYEDSLWVWRVNTSLEGNWGISRRVGAWELHRGSRTFTEDLEALVLERMAVATKAGLAAVESAGVRRVCWVDLGATLAAVSAIRDEYQQLFDAEQSARIKSKQMRELSWPKLPEPLNLEKPPPARGQGADAQVGKTLAIAAWVDQLVRAFEDIEAIRADRAVLRDAFDAQEFPAVLI